MDAFQLGGYGGYVNGPWHLDGILSYGFLKTDTKRFIDVGTSIRKLMAVMMAAYSHCPRKVVTSLSSDQVTIEPTVGLDYAHLSQDSFNETGIAAYRWP